MKTIDADPALSSTPPQSETPQSEFVREGRAPAGLRFRAFVIGLPLLVCVCLISVYADMVSKVVQFGVLQFAPPALAVIFAIALLNRGFGKMLKHEILSRADMMVIYIMMVIGVMVSTRGVIEKLVPALAFLPYYANRENGLNAAITQHLPKWAVPFTPSANAVISSPGIKDYYEAGTPAWSIWVGPLCAWFALIACVLWCFACIATLLRRQWMDNEQLRFPLASLPLAVIQDQVEGQKFFSNRLMWMGFALPAIIFGMNGLAANFPDWPKFVTEFPIMSLFSDRPWNAISYTGLYISLAGIGFAYFLPVDLLFSLWFFFVMTRWQDIMATQLGAPTSGIGTHDATVWTGYQAAGAYVVLVFAQLRIGWPYFKQVWKTAFGTTKPLDDSGEMLSYRTAILGLIAGFSGIVLWLSIAGMSPWLAMAQMGIYIFFISIIMARAVSEAGLLMTETSFLPEHLISLVYPLPNLGAQNLAMFGLTNIIFVRDMRGVMLTPLMDGQKLTKELGLRPRMLLFPVALAFLVSFVVAAAFFLYLSYTKGNTALYGYPMGNARNMFNRAAGHIGGGTPAAGAAEYGGFVVGLVFTSFLVWARGTWTWFPLHPLGYAIAPTWAMLTFWFPFLCAWIIKSLVLRFGGIDTYRRLAPFMLGMVFGEFMSAVFWSVMNMWRGWSTPAFPWP